MEREHAKKKRRKFRNPLRKTEYQKKCLQAFIVFLKFSIFLFLDK